MENAKRIVGGLWAVVLLSLFSIGTVLADTAGYVQFVSGDVQLTTAAGQAHSLKKGDAVDEGDTLISAKNSTAQIKMQDGGLIAVRPDTRLKFDSFKYSGKEDGRERSFFSLLKGGFRAVTGMIGRTNKSNYRITTPAATIGIRGTDHETFVVVPGGPFATIAPTGTYNKVNIGETSLSTDKATLIVHPNQMGFAGGRDQFPELQPVNINIFTAAPPPTPQVQRNEEGGGGTANMGSGSGASNVVGASDTSLPPSIVPPTVVMVTPQPTSSSTTLSSAYVGSSIAPGVYSSGWDGIETVVAPHAVGTPPSLIQLSSLGAGGVYTFDATGLVLKNCGTGCFTGIGTAQNVDVGGVAGVVEWGRWSSGVTSAGGWGNGLNFGANQGWHYLVGVVTPLMQIPVSGTFTYNLIGGTSPTPSDGVGGGLGIGHLISGSTTVNFSTATVNGNLVMGFNGASIYQANYSGTMGTTGQTLNGMTTFQSGNINVCGTGGCSTQYQGQFFGTNAAYLGVGYNITTNQNFIINGVAVTKR